MSGKASEYLPEILKACAAAEEAHQRYQSTSEPDPAHIWDARARAFEKEVEVVGGYYVEISELLLRYRRAIWFLQDIAAMSKKVGSETATHALAQLGEPRHVDEEERKKLA